MRRRAVLFAGGMVLGGALAVMPAMGAAKGSVREARKLSDTAPALSAKSAPVKSGAAGAVKPKPLSAQVRQGLQWLVRTQQKSGGWSQGEESSEMGRGMNGLQDAANVADTCIATLALLRAGNSPTRGEYAESIRRAVEFLCTEVEKSDAKSLSVTSIQGTRVQGKLGPYIDTFLASMVLTEVRGKMPEAKSQKRVAAAFNKVMDKIERNQQPDGTWNKEGWAPALAQSMASKAINRAAQTGGRVNEEVRQKAETYARGGFNARSGSFAADGAAGVALYAGASSLGALQDSENTNRGLEGQARDKLRLAKTPGERKEAEQTLKRFSDHRQTLQQAQQAVIKRLDDKDFIAGFGSNGGEEFLSYMNIGESLAAKGGADWRKWDVSMTQNLNHIQNEDGSWSGHHCITGRTFCTAAALMVLTVDRAPMPMASKIARR